jgi:hypothetical protein
MGFLGLILWVFFKALLCFSQRTHAWRSYISQRFTFQVLPVNTHTFLYLNNSTCPFTDKHEPLKIGLLVSGKASETVWSVLSKKTWPGSLLLGWGRWTHKIPIAITGESTKG